MDDTGAFVTFAQALERINGLEGRAWRLGLDRMRAFVQISGLEATLVERNYIHVAGTNGKGTTTAFVESILRHQGHRTGAFFSPYVVDYRERIQALGRLIQPDDLVNLMDRLSPFAVSMASTEYGGISKFEMEAALGLAFWRDQRCDWVAVEVGLGGRFDATNVIESGACIIVSIGLDHTGILGKTVAEIAAEKAGIIKPGVPVIVGAVPPEAAAVIGKIAALRGAPVWWLGQEIRLEEMEDTWTVSTPLGSFGGLRPPALGYHTPGNMALAVAACVAAKSIEHPEKVPEGVLQTWLPGRMERRMVRGREVILDGAHNADAANALVRTLPAGPVRLLTNMVSGHEVSGFYDAFRSRAVGADVAPINSPRALAVDEAAKRIDALGIPAIAHPSVDEAWAAALAQEDGLLLVTGSNYLVGEILRLID